MSNYYKELMEEVTKIRKVAKFASSEEKRAYSEYLLENEIPILNNFAAEELDINTAKHLRVVLNSSDIGIVYLGFENCLENSFLSGAVKYSLIIEFYEKIIRSESLIIKMQATKKLESLSLFYDYLKGKPNSESYKKQFYQLYQEQQRNDEQIELTRTVSPQEHSLLREYAVNPTSKISNRIKYLKDASIQRVRKRIL